MITQDKITSQHVQTLSELFHERVKRTPQHTAYYHFDKENKIWQSLTWLEMSNHIIQWQEALIRENLKPGDRVAIMLRNSPQWVMFDQAALGLGLVTVPLYVEDRPDNVAYILAETEAKFLLLENPSQWKNLYPIRDEFSCVTRIVMVHPLEENIFSDVRLIALEHWLSKESSVPFNLPKGTSESLASIIYTSGTTGRPKGVMLTHNNLLSNAFAASKCFDFQLDDLFLSFLPLSHTFERTAGYYLPMVSGSMVAYARSIQQLGTDLITLRPTILISVPRIYEQVYSKIRNQLEKSFLNKKIFHLAVETGWRHFEYQQNRSNWHPILLLLPLLQKQVAQPLLDKLGGKVRLAISGGSALPFPVAKMFLAIGLNLVQGYGLTETSPIISVNRLEDNIPQGIGTPLPDIEVKLGENEELLTKSSCVMLGYWKNLEATQKMIDEQGWLHTGDQARIDEKGHLYITGRIKEIIVLGNGEKVPPIDMEMKITLDSLFEQVLVVGEGRPFLTALVVLNKELWHKLAQGLTVDPTHPDSLKAKAVHKIVLERIGHQIKEFPGYAQIRRVFLLLDPWTIENGFLTPTLKIKRAPIMKKYASSIEEMYKGF